MKISPTEVYKVSAWGLAGQLVNYINQLYLCGVYTEHTKLNQMLLEILLRFPELGAKMIHPKQDNHK